MQRYQCHKQVEAGKIIKLIYPENKPYAALITLEDSSEVQVEQAFLDKHNPEPGCYLVRYQDGYLSCSPAQAFEEGYSQIVE